MVTSLKGQDSNPKRSKVRMAQVPSSPKGHKSKWSEPEGTYKSENSMQIFN